MSTLRVRRTDKSRLIESVFDTGKEGESSAPIVLAVLLNCDSRLKSVLLCRRQPTK